MKYRWNAKNTPSGTMINKKDAGAINPMFERTGWEKMSTVIGVVLRAITSRDGRRSYSIQMPWKIASDAIAGQA